MLIAIDTETFRFGQGNTFPKIVCWSWATEDGQSDVVSNADDSTAFEFKLQEALAQHELVFVNAAYDLGVIMAHWPEWTPLIFEALQQERIYDCALIENELNLADYGKIDYEPGPRGWKKKPRTSMAWLAKKYLGLDLSADKESVDAWRLNYHLLDGIPSREWPAEAFEYARKDAETTLLIFEQQIPFSDCIPETHHFQVKVDFALSLTSSWGFMIDLEEKARVVEWLAEATKESNFPLLISGGVLRPSQPAMPYSNGARAHVEDCPRKKQNKEWLCDCPVKMKQPVKASRDMAVFREVIERVCENNHIPVKRTETGLISTDSEFMGTIANLSPLLEEYVERERYAKLVSTEIPRMGENAGPVHPVFDVLKETGRTSSYSVDKYPSLNGQNVDPRVRPCYIARPGCLFLSVDYKSLELVTLAQTCLTLFGYSVLANNINKGIDAHAYLGSQLAYNLDHDFHDYCEELRGMPEEIYKAFLELKEDEDEDCRKFFKHWRKFAKPVGLGYPGGLGAKTFITFARGTYGVRVTEQEAKVMKEIWLNTYPEMKDYFGHVNRHLVDQKNSTKDDRKYRYETPFGMVRAGASYCAAANGLALQSPGAEGAKLGLYGVVRACYDESLDSILWNERVVNFVHDEIILEIEEDGQEHEKYLEVDRIMCASLQEVTPDIKVSTEPALTRRWYKQAEPIFKGGRLAVWEPE